MHSTQKQYLIKTGALQHVDKKQERYYKNYFRFAATTSQRNQRRIKAGILNTTYTMAIQVHHLGEQIIFNLLGNCQLQSIR
jgi:hypothetical protein